MLDFWTSALVSVCVCARFFSVLFAPGSSAKARCNERSEEESGNLHAWSGGCFVLGYCLGPRLLLMHRPTAFGTGSLFLPWLHGPGLLLWPWALALALGDCSSVCFEIMLWPWATASTLGPQDTKTDTGQRISSQRKS